MRQAAQLAPAAAAASTRWRSPASSACCAKRRRPTWRGLFSAQELADSGDGPGRAASLAARFAAKEACLKLFPRETALGQIEAARLFGGTRQLWRAASCVCGPIAAALLGRYRIKDIALSLSHDRVSASAVAVARGRHHRRAAVRKVPLPVPADPARRDPRESAPRLRRAHRGERDRPPRAGALRAPVAAVRANSCASAGCRTNARWRWCASRTSRPSPARSRRTRAC